MTERPGYRVAADKRRSRTAPRRQGHRPGAHQVLDGSALRHQGRGKGKLTVAGYAPSSGPGRGQAAVPPGAVSRPGPHYRSNRSLTFTVTEKSQEKTRESYL